MSDSAASEQATPGETTPAAPPEPPAPAAGGIPPMPPLPPRPPYAAPAAAPPRGYAAPQGYAPPAPTFTPPHEYAPPPQGYGPFAPPPQPPRPTGGSGVGVVAFALAVTAALGAMILGAVAGYRIGLGTGRGIVLNPAGVGFDWSILTPVRESVLLGEIAFWAGTMLGIWALVQGTVAIIRNRGRGWGIAAVVIAVIGPIAFATSVQVLLAAGFASGASVGG